MVHFLLAKIPKKRGHPSGGLGTLLSGHINSKLFTSSNHFLAGRVGETVIINEYLPTDYSDDCSEMKFALACKELGKRVNKISATVYDNWNEGASENLLPVCQIPACPSTMVKQLLGH